MNKITKLFAGSIIGIMIVIILLLKQELKSSPELSTFQQNMATNCQTSKTAEHTTTIDSAYLPVNIDSKSQFLLTPETLLCIYPSDKPSGNGLVSIPTTQNRSLFLYDNYSQEIGRGGEPLLGTYGAFVTEIDGVNFYTYVSSLSDTQPVTIQTFTIRLRGVKNFSDGMEANYDTQIFSLPDEKINLVIGPFFISGSNPFTGEDLQVLDYTKLPQINEKLAHLINSRRSKNDLNLQREVNNVISVIGIVTEK